MEQRGGRYRDYGFDQVSPPPLPPPPPPAPSRVPPTHQFHGRGLASYPSVPVITSATDGVNGLLRTEVRNTTSHENLHYGRHWNTVKDRIHKGSPFRRLLAYVRKQFKTTPPKGPPTQESFPSNRWTTFPASSSLSLNSSVGSQEFSQPSMSGSGESSPQQSRNPNVIVPRQGLQQQAIPPSHHHHQTLHQGSQHQQQQHQPYSHHQTPPPPNHQQQQQQQQPQQQQEPEPRPQQQQQTQQQELQSQQQQQPQQHPQQQQQQPHQQQPQQQPQQQQELGLYLQPQQQQQQQPQQQQEPEPLPQQQQQQQQQEPEPLPQQQQQQLPQQQPQQQQQQQQLPQQQPQQQQQQTQQQELQSQQQQQTQQQELQSQQQQQQQQHPQQHPQQQQHQQQPLQQQNQQQQQPHQQQQQPQQQQQLPQQQSQQQQPPQQQPQQQQQQQVQQTQANIFSRRQTNCFRLLLAIDLAARPVMQNIFFFGAQGKSSTETLKDYLINSKGVSMPRYRQAFNRTAREKIDNDPSCQCFDVSLWLVAIQYGCDGLAPPRDDVWINSPDTLEYNLKKIKDFRNATMHSEIAICDQDFHKSIEEIRNLLIKTLELAKIRYSVDSTQMSAIIAELNKNINFIRDNPLTKLDLKSYESQALFKALQNILETDGIGDLVKWFARLTQINPASLIAGYNINLLVGNIFSALEIVEAGRRQGDETLIDHTTFLQYAHQLRQKEGSNLGQVILIEGVAGVGKTTLIKMLISEWTSGNCSVKELDRYKFIIPVECRSRSTSCLSHHLAFCMPTARKRFQEGHHIMECMLDLPTMIIVDGLDEMNSVSKMLVMEILQLKNIDNVTILCTTRPEKVKDYYQMIPQDKRTVHIKIKGVPEKCTETFVFKYHEELRNKGYSQQETAGLLTYFRTTGARLEEHWNLPLNLTLVTLLWAVDPSRVNRITTPVELLVQIQELTIEKLLTRLRNYHGSIGDPSTLRQRIDIFLGALGKEALLGIRDDAIILQDKATQRLIDICSSLSLPHEEVLGAFLVQELSWLPSSLKGHFIHPHKSLQEMFASRCIYEELAIDNRSYDTDAVLKSVMGALHGNAVPSHISQDIMKYSTTKLSKSGKGIFSKKVTILSILKKSHEEISVPLSIDKYQNTLIYLLGLFYHYKKDPERALVEELIELLRRTGIDDRERWISVLNDIQCNGIVARLIARIPGVMEGTLVIRDNNTLAYGNVMDEKKAESVDLKVTENPSHIPRLIDILDCILRQKIDVPNLWLEHLYRHPTTNGPLLEALAQMMNKNRVDRYRGQMTKDIKRIPPSTDRLALSILDGETFEALQQIVPSAQNLEWLCVGMSADFDDLDWLTPLSGTIKLLRMMLKDVSDHNVINACDIMKRLNPVDGDKKFYYISLPYCSLTPKGLRRLIEEPGVNEGGKLYLPQRLKDQELQRIARYDISWKDEEALW